MFEMLHRRGQEIVPVGGLVGLGEEVHHEEAVVDAEVLVTGLDVGIPRGLEFLVGPDETLSHDGGVVDHLGEVLLEGLHVDLEGGVGLFGGGVLRLGQREELPDEGLLVRLVEVLE